MKQLEIYLHEQIDVFAKKYEGSPCVDDLIGLKKKLDKWLEQKTLSIHMFYKSNKTEDKISYVCNYSAFKMRLIFYKSGGVKMNLTHNDSFEVVLKDKGVIGEYCLDVGSVYFIESEFGWKIGKAKLIGRRRNEFGVQLPFVFALRYHIKTANKSELERYFHNYFRDRQINGEWYFITNEEIKKVVSELPGLKLSGYSPDDNIFIERRYLDKIEGQKYDPDNKSKIELSKNNRHNILKIS